MGSRGPRSRLRGELTEFVGRRAELAVMRQALGTARLVMLTWPGGIGKTRLAIEAASAARRALRDGCGRQMLLVLDQCERVAVTVSPVTVPPTAVDPPRRRHRAVPLARVVTVVSPEPDGTSRDWRR